MKKRYVVVLFSDEAHELSGNLYWDRANGPRMFDSLGEARREAIACVGQPIDPREWGNVVDSTVRVSRARVARLAYVKEGGK